MKSSLLLTSCSVIAAAFLHASPPNIHETRVHQLADRRIIIERASGITLPDPPEPVVRMEPEPQTAERLAFLAAEWRAHLTAHPFIHAGVTVYRLPDGNTISHVTNWSVNNGPTVSFWSSADISLIAHPAGFTHASTEGGVNYTILLFCSHHDVGWWTEMMAKRGLEYDPGNFPAFAEGPATWIFDESKATEKPDAATVRAITHLHEHYQQNLTSLREAYAKLEAERAARRAELEANPPQPRDIHLRVSRLTPTQAAAWHQHAVAATTGGRHEAPAQNGGGK